MRLYPTPRQEDALRFMLDVTRQLYNAALQERKDAYRMRRLSRAFGAASRWKQIAFPHGDRALRFDGDPGLDKLLRQLL